MQKSHELDYFMSKFRHLDTKEPAEMGAVLEAVVRLSTLSEDEILSLVSEGHLEDSFPFSAQAQALPPDFVAEEDLEEASALPLSRADREALIQASMPPSGSPMSIDRLAAALAKQEEILRSAEQASHG
jgi:hypothetical protein